MKPPPFVHHAPETVPRAVATLAALAAEGGKVLAGGQSLVPLLNMRLAAPGHLVDINGVAGLDTVEATNGGVRVGALARHARVERDPDAAAALPLLRRALRLVAHPAIRNRGTCVGSLVHADPAAELPAVLALLGGRVEAHSTRGARTVAAADLFVGPLESSVAADELVVAAHFPAPPPRSGTAIAEIARRHGDYALCGVAAVVTLDADLRVAAARAAYLSMAPVPRVVDLADAVAGRPFDTADWPAAAALAAGQLEPEPDLHATAAYRAHLARVLTVRVLREAAGDAVDRATTTAPAPATTSHPE